MRGVLYALTEIAAFLVIATVIGYLLGRLHASMASPRAEPAGSPPAEAEIAEPALPGLDEEMERKDAELRELSSRNEALERELTSARWQIQTLEAALPPEPGGE